MYLTESKSNENTKYVSENESRYDQIQVLLVPYSNTVANMGIFFSVRLRTEDKNLLIFLLLRWDYLSISNC